MKHKSTVSIIAFCTRMLKIQGMNRAAAMAFGIALLAGGSTLTIAQGPPPAPAEGAGEQGQPKPPKPEPRPEGMPWGPGGRPEGRDGREGRGRRDGGGDRERMDSFRNMTEEERQKVRDAFEKAWKNPAVLEARERLAKANDEYREALHNALKEADPEAVALLEKHKPQGGPAGMMPMPDVKDPEFAKKAIMRLGMELHALSRTENLEFPNKEIFQRLQAVPAIKEAVAKLQAAEPRDRMEAWKQLVTVFQEAARKELPKRDGGPRREDGFGFGPGPGGSGPGSGGPGPRREGGPPPGPGPEKDRDRNRPSFELR